MKKDAPARRRLSIDTAEPTDSAQQAIPQPTPALKALAVEVFTLNGEMNLAKRGHDKSRKSLLDAMDALSLTNFNFTLVTATTGRITLEAAIAAPEREAVDPAKLRALVSDEVFMQCVTATKEAVDQFAGKAVTAACVRVVPGSRNVTVRKAK